MAVMQRLRHYGLPIGLIVVGLMLSAVSPFGVLLFFAVVVFLLVRHRDRPPALCDTCRFNSPEECRRLERPTATVCAGYERAPQRREPRGQVVAFRPPPGEA